MDKRFSKNISYFWYGALTFAARDLKTRYAGSLLGIVWIILYPLSMAAITSVVFALAFQKNIENVPFFLFTLAGFSAWIFFSQTISASARALVHNRDIIVNNKMPTELILGGVVLSRCVDLGITSLFLTVAAGFTGVLSIQPLLLLQVLFILFLITIVVSMLVAASNVYFRDVQALSDIILNVLFYATPVVYPLNLIPEKYLWVFNLNPLTPVFMGFRSSFLPLAFDTDSLSYLLPGAIIATVPAFFIYKHLERKFAQYL